MFLDVEGFEDKVLLGMQRTLAESSPDIIVECNPDGPYKGVEAALAPHGYRFFQLGPDGPTAVENIIPDAEEENRNYLCTVKQESVVHLCWHNG